MIKSGYILWLQGDGHTLANASPPGRVDPPARYNLGTFLAQRVLLVSDVGETHTHTMRRELPDVSLVYPWSRTHLAELLSGSETRVRMVGREVTQDFRKIMAGYYSSENNPNHFWLDQQSLMQIRMAF